MFSREGDSKHFMGPALKRVPASHPISQQMSGESADALSDCEDAHLSDEEYEMGSIEKEVSPVTSTLAVGYYSLPDQPTDFCPNNSLCPCHGSWQRLPYLFCS